MSFFAIRNLHKSFSAKSVIRGMDFEMIQEIKRMKKPSFFGTIKEIVL
ncbi:MAG: hypothetical protein Q4D65_00625 [Peptostreptococcaceae bacterium]|nr:hypothetical protein [Peptostreptococcaceae bacterium]